MKKFIVLIVFISSLVASVAYAEDSIKYHEQSKISQDIPPELVNLRGKELYLKSLDNIYLIT